MDNQSAGNSCSNSCSNGKVLKILVLVVIALQLVGFGLNANYFTSIISYVGMVPVASVVPAREVVTGDEAGVLPVSVNGYSNTDYGFALTVPKAWNDIGFVTKTEVGANGQTVFNYYLAASSGADNSFFRVSSVGVYPVATYVKDQCAEEGPCVPGEEIGRNSQYVFVSETFSPEAFGACYDADTEEFGGDFYQNNKQLCEVGATGRQSERVKGSFTAFEVK